ncbi:MAG: hypothetical protein ABIP13_08805 [Tepidiformaceae bacterium]
MRLRAVLLLAMVFAVIGAGFALHGGASASRGKVFTVEVSETGFNPQVCQISRDNLVQFKNVGTATRRVVLPGTGANPEPLFDSGDLGPGQISNPQLFPHGGSVKFFDKYRPELSVTIVLPVFTEAWDDICAPLHAVPTPPKPLGCVVKANCAVLPLVAREP